MKYLAKKWVNRSYGPSGIVLWALLGAWPILVYAIYLIFPRMNIFDTQKPLDLIIIDWFTLIGELFIAISFIIFFIQSINTVESITITNNRYVDAKLFYGRRMQFETGDIKAINVFAPKGIKRIYTPFKTDKSNYKIELKDDRYLFVIGSTQDVDRLIASLNKSLEYLGSG